MMIYPWLRLLKLDVTLLINLALGAYRRVGLGRSLPLMTTAVLFIPIIAMIDLSNIFYPRKPATSYFPWMVRRQFSLVNKSISESEYLLLAMNYWKKKSDDKYPCYIRSGKKLYFY